MKIKRSILFPAALLFVLISITAVAAPIIMQKSSLGASWSPKKQTGAAPASSSLGSANLPDNGLQGQVAQAASSDCTYHYYYWKAHPELWPDTLAIGKLMVTKQQAGNLFQSQVGTDQAAAAKDPIQYLTLEAYITSLNIKLGSSSYEIQQILTDSENWLANNANNHSGSAFDGSVGINLAQNLNDFNTGYTGPGLCANQPPLPTITATPTAGLTSTSSPTPTQRKKQIVSQQGLNDSKQSEQDQPQPPAPPAPPAPTATPTPLPTATPAPPTATPPSPTATPNPPTAAPPPKATPKPPDPNQPPDKPGKPKKPPKNNQDIKNKPKKNGSMAVPISLV